MTHNLEQLCSGIQLLVLDVDGVLTDGKLLYGDGGELGKNFNVKDGYGMRQAMKHGIAIAVISGRGSAGAEARLSELGVEHVYLKCEDKIKQIRQLQRALVIGAENTAVVGDDIPDLAMMGEAALAIAVGDAVAEVREKAQWITKQIGGHGAVREVCDKLVNSRTTLD